MDEFTKTRLAVCLIVGTGLFLSINSAHCHGQNVFRDYVVDRNSQYSPFDDDQRGLVYRLQNGFAGLFGNCDDDRQKKVSPYIDWHCRQPRRIISFYFVKELFTDIFRKSERLNDGAGDCVIDRCNVCREHLADCNCQSGSSISGISGNYKYRGRPDALSGENVRHRPSSSKSSLNEIQNRQFASIYERESRRDHTHSLSETTQSSKQVGYFATSSAGIKESNQGTSSRLSQAPDTSRQSEASTKTKQLANHVSRIEKRTPVFDLGSVQIDPRFREPEGLLPADRFKSVERRANESQKQRRVSSGSDFQLSGGAVYPRRSTQTTKKASSLKTDRSSSTQRTASRSTFRNREPVQGRKSDPQYFQFQQIGGSRYR